ncbi:MAG: hypothetical protein H0V82_08510 [Candidatus Protochlamydia sp.]|nr:hypothetical protein [Candidatus Protochlamydia sp.]
MAIYLAAFFEKLAVFGRIDTKEEKSSKFKKNKINFKLVWVNVKFYFSFFCSAIMQKLEKLKKIFL